MTDNIKTTLIYAKNQNPEFQYRVIFQSRANPSKIKKCNNEDGDYYVVNRTEDIRPYRIIIIHENDLKKVYSYKYE
jgi:hypothetical protein